MLFYDNFILLHKSQIISKIAPPMGGGKVKTHNFYWLKMLKIDSKILKFITI